MTQISFQIEIVPGTETARVTVPEPGDWPANLGGVGQVWGAAAPFAVDVISFLGAETKFGEIVWDGQALTFTTETGGTVPYVSGEAVYLKVPVTEPSQTGVYLLAGLGGTPSAPPPPPTGGGNHVLDQYPSTQPAIGLQQLRAAYTGPCITVRQEGGGEQDFWFVNGLLDMAGIVAFCAGARGFVSRAYDHNGVHNWVPSQIAWEPLICENGAVIVNEEGLPAMRFDGPGNPADLVAQGYDPTANLAAMVTQRQALSKNSVQIWEGASTTKYAGVGADESTASTHSGAGSPVDYVDGVQVSPQTRQSIHDLLWPGSPQTRVWGARGIAAANWNGVAVYGYNGTASSTYQHDGLLSELVMWLESEISEADFIAAQQMSVAAWS